MNCNKEKYLIMMVLAHLTTPELSRKPPQEQALLELLLIIQEQSMLNQGL